MVQRDIAAGNDVAGSMVDKVCAERVVDERITAIAGDCFELFD
jgi:hypothetical protein